MTAINIVDVIDHRNQYNIQRMLVLDRMPDFIYERRGSRLLIGHDSGFFKFYGYESSSPGWEAFGGAKFEIPMADGSVVEASGQWWDVCPSDYAEVTYSHGVKSIEGLEECYVFRGGIHVDRELVDAWLADNEPGNNYDKYNRKHPNYGKHRIVSRFDEPATA